MGIWGFFFLPFFPSFYYYYYFFPIFPNLFSRPQKRPRTPTLAKAVSICSWRSGKSPHTFQSLLSSILTDLEAHLYFLQIFVSHKKKKISCRIHFLKVSSSSPCSHESNALFSLSPSLLLRKSYCHLLILGMSL